MRGMDRLARVFGIGADYEPKPAKKYESIVAGSRATGRFAGASGWRQRWIAGDFRAGTDFRTRRAALKHCPPGVLPILVRVPPKRVEELVSARFVGRSRKAATA